jgi:hypothetical protein
MVPMSVNTGNMDLNIPCPRVAVALTGKLPAALIAPLHGWQEEGQKGCW